MPSRDSHFSVPGSLPSVSVYETLWRLLRLLCIDVLGRKLRVQEEQGRVTLRGPLVLFL